MLHSTCNGLSGIFHLRTTKLATLLIPTTLSKAEQKIGVASLLSAAIDWSSHVHFSFAVHPTFCSQQCCDATPTNATARQMLLAPVTLLCSHQNFASYFSADTAISFLSMKIQCPGMY